MIPMLHEKEMLREREDVSLRDFDGHVWDFYAAVTR